MAGADTTQPRARNGRFVKRKNAAAKRSVRPSAGVTAVPVRESQGGAASTVPSLATDVSRDGLVQIGILTVAIVLAVLGFAVHLLWIGSLVVMGVLWGMLIAERQQRVGTVKGLAAELVSTVVDEAKGVAEVVDIASSPDSDEATTPSMPPGSLGGGGNRTAEGNS